VTTAVDMLAHLESRRSVRQFADRPIAREALERCLRAATTAPSATNRQPWRFVAVTAPGRRRAIAAAVRERAAALDAAIRPGPHAAEWDGYGDFFWQPLAAAAAIVVPCLREVPDAIAGFLRSAGADPDDHARPSAMQPERCATGAACMALLLQAHAEGLAGCWMAGPMVARVEIEGMLAIEPPWQMLGAIALGHPVAAPPPAPPRRPLERVVEWIEGDG
jgi:nitroreductase